MSLDISLKHLAEAAGVSRTTVSLALRNHPRISLAMREKIQALAKEMGYVPNAEVSKVMGMIRESKESGDRPVLGMITDYDHPLRSQQPPSDTWLGFASRAAALGYSPEEFWVGDGKLSPRRLGDILHARGIRGFVFSALLDPSFAAQMDLSGFACASIGLTIHKPALHRSSSDKYANTLLACQKLWDRDCRRIALAVPFKQEDRVEYTFLSGYLIFHHLHRHKGWSVPIVDEGEWSPSRIADWVRKEKVDGLIAAYPGLEAFLPEIPLARVNVMNGIGPGINQRHDRIAAGAVDLVDAQLRRNETGVPELPKLMMISGDWIPGK
ncbi:MAG: LacI family DNA-binding transcriptional regulator [Verrucomicrobia bacterium]|nr:LacI family DNA-binding transcriptional regulator [Verrucomicrobiota bacterium]MCH8512418.1 LacI family DNA-binding transcriptional regulator [Kiritimatiellia bacterium]